MNIKSNFLDIFLRREKKIKCLSLLSSGGLFLTRVGTNTVNKGDLEGCFLGAIIMFTKSCFESELTQLKLKNNIIFIMRSKHLMTYLILDNTEIIDATKIKLELRKILSNIEKACPEMAHSRFDLAKIEIVTEKFSKKYLNIENDY